MRRYCLRLMLIVILSIPFMAINLDFSSGAVNGELHSLKVLNLGKGKSISIHYTIGNINEEYFTNILDQLKAGKTLRIVHDVTLSDVNALTDNIVEVEFSKYISLDVIRHEYSYGENLDSLYTSKDTSYIRHYLLSIEEEIIKNVSTSLTAGEEYNVNVSFYAKPYGTKVGWLEYFPQSWLYETLNIKETYIAR